MHNRDIGKEILDGIREIKARKAHVARETEIITDIVDRLSRFPAVESVRLYGSRARGDADEKSDFDIAIAAPNADRAQWQAILDSIEAVETLLEINLVRLEEAGGEFRERIVNEGKVLYERREDGPL